MAPMNDTLSWTLSGFIAGLALLSLTATGAEPPKAPGAQRVVLAQDAPGRPASAVMADAYFDLARGEAETGPDDWYVRHQMTLKGLAAQRGESIFPEEPAAHALKAKDKETLARAQRSLAEWQVYFASPEPQASNTALPLFAALQARYDWWLLSAEAGAPASAIEAARTRFEDLRSALLASTRQNRLATL